MEDKKCWRHGIYGAVSVLVVFFLICMFLFPSVGIDQIENFIARHGSLIAGLIAFGAAFIALYSQREATRNQASIQFTIEDNKLFISKVEELYDTVQRLRLKAILIRSDEVKNSTSAIDELYLDLGKASMICRLHRVISQELFEEYRSNTEFFIDAWSDLAKSKIDPDGTWLVKEVIFKSRFEKFRESSNKVLLELAKNSNVK
ncbi:MAG: hypothetical protein ACRCXK_11245 [Wohlfahrtiimonas sp.]